MRRLPDAHYLALGRMTAAAGKLEYVAEWLLSDLIGGNSNATAALITNMSTTTLLDKLRLIVAGRFETAGEVHQVPMGTGSLADRAEEFAAALSRCERALQERNKMTHAYWQPDPFGGITVTRFTRGKTGRRDSLRLQHLGAPVSADEVNAVADELEACSQELTGFIAHVVSQATDTE